MVCMHSWQNGTRCRDGLKKVFRTKTSTCRDAKLDGNITTYTFCDLFLLFFIALFFRDGKIELLLIMSS